MTNLRYRCAGGLGRYFGKAVAVKGAGPFELRPRRTREPPLPRPDRAGEGVCEQKQPLDALKVYQGTWYLGDAFKAPVTHLIRYRWRT